MIKCKCCKKKNDKPKVDLIGETNESQQGLNIAHEQAIELEKTEKRMCVSLVAYWLIFGTVFYTYFHLMGQSIDWSTTVGGFSLFWRISLFAPFAPHGLGVFEPSFIALVGWTVNALFLVGAFRVVLLIRDLLLTGIAGLFIKKPS